MPRAATRFLAVAALGVSLAACQSAAAPTPAPLPPTLAPTAAPAAAAANPASVSVAGTVDQLSGQTLSVDTNTGPKDVSLSNATQFEKDGSLSVSDLKPGENVGITGNPDGTAVSIRVFPPGLNIRASQFPMTGADQGHVMTNTTIKSFDGKTLVADLNGDAVTIQVPAGIPVTGPTPASLADITAGKRVNVSATPSGPNGALVANSVYVSGSPGQPAQ